MNLVKAEAFATVVIIVMVYSVSYISLIGQILPYLTLTPNVIGPITQRKPSYTRRQYNCNCSRKCLEHLTFLTVWIPYQFTREF